jgi:hypothetical protein
VHIRQDISKTVADPTRRQAIVGGIASVFVIGTGLRLSLPSGITNCRIPLLPVIAASSPTTCQDIVDTHFPGYFGSVFGGQLRLASAIVKNDTQTDIYACEISWRSGSSDETYARSYMHAPQLNHSPLATGVIPILRRGEYGLVTPYFLCSASRYNRLGGTLPFSAMTAGQPISHSFVSRVSGVAVPTWLAVILATSNVVEYGPSFLAANYEAYRNTERHLANQGVEFLTNNPHATAKQFESLMATRSYSHAKQSEFARCRYIKLVTMSLNDFGREETLSRIAPIAKRRAFRLVRS